MADPSHDPHDRRAMFRLGLKRLMEPVADYIEKRLNVPLPMYRSVLRPPGALPEKEFLDTCYRCGNCVDVCPAKAIRTMNVQEVEQTGTPYIDADLAACVVCDELSCMRSCPSGALKLVPSREEIAMGLARVDGQVCVRSHGEDCRLCVDKCPLGTTAIDIGEVGEVVVKISGCVGCGVCQFYCPTTPKAIVVSPS